MALKKCRQLRVFPVFNWEEYPGKGIVADIFVDKQEEDIQPYDNVILEDEVYVVEELILYTGQQQDSMVGVVTQELREAHEIDL